MFYVYVTKSAPDPVKFETMAEACSFVTSQAQPAETRLFTEETHAKLLVRRSQKDRAKRVQEIMAEQKCSRIWAYELYRREHGYQPLEHKRRGPKLSVQRLKEKIADLESRAAEYKRQLAELEPVDTTCPVISDTSQRVEPGVKVPIEVRAVVGVCREDSPADVDAAYGPGTYEKLFPAEGDQS